MIAEQRRVWHSAERRPPELGLESFLVNAVHQGFHIGVSVGEFLGIKLPIAHIVLPTVVEGDPLESQSLCRRKRVVDLLRLHRSAISPSAPNRPETILGSGGHFKPLFHHEAAVVGEGAKVISLVDGDEGAKGMKAFTGTQRDFFTKAYSDRGMSGIGHGYGERNELRPCLDVSHSHANVT